MSVGHRTVLAQQAMDASDVIHMTFAKRVIGRDPPRRLVVQVPDGPSTEGGKRARQSITLAPQSGEGPALMCGWLDVSRHEAELRSFEMVAAQYETRFGQHFEVTAEEYRELMRDLQRTLHNLQVATHVAELASLPGRAAVQPHDGAGGRSRALLYVLLALVASGVALFVALR